MAILNIDDALEDFCTHLKTVTVGDGEKGFRTVERGFKTNKELAIGDFPVAMLGLESVDVGSMSDIGNILMVCLVRGTTGARNLKYLRKAVIDALIDHFYEKNIGLSDIELGDIFPGFTEPAETEVLPDGAYIASWLRIERPVNGFFIKFSITVETG